jgi:class 3 adenylate cyclase
MKSMGTSSFLVRKGSKEAKDKKLELRIKRKGSKERDGAFPRPPIKRAGSGSKWSSANMTKAKEAVQAQIQAYKSVTKSIGVRRSLGNVLNPDQGEQQTRSHARTIAEMVDLRSTMFESGYSARASHLLNTFSLPCILSIIVMWDMMKVYVHPYTGSQEVNIKRGNNTIMVLPEEEREIPPIDLLISLSAACISMFVTLAAIRWYHSLHLMTHRTYENVLTAYYVWCGLSINIAEMATGYLGIGGSAITFIIFFVFSFGKLGLIGSLKICAVTLFHYMGTAVFFVARSDEPHSLLQFYDYRTRILVAIPNIGYILVLLFPTLYFVEKLQKKNMSLQDDLVRVEGEMKAQVEMSQHLLLNVLPPEIMIRFLPSNDKNQSSNGSESSIIADKHENCSILFGHVVGFDEATEKLPIVERVAMLNLLWQEFDSIIDTYSCIKIKTIADTYMAACGLPTDNPRHAHNIAKLGLAMTRALRKFATNFEFYDLSYKIGIASGTCVAGVIGTSKFSYDIWGDTVNLASRMYSHSLKGCIQMTEETQALIGEEFETKRRGVVVVKGKGEMVTHFLLKRRRSGGSSPRKTPVPTVRNGQKPPQRRQSPPVKAVVPSAVPSIIHDGSSVERAASPEVIVASSMVKTAIAAGLEAASPQSSPAETQRKAVPGAVASHEASLSLDTTFGMHEVSAMHPMPVCLNMHSLQFSTNKTLSNLPTQTSCAQQLRITPISRCKYVQQRSLAVHIHSLLMNSFLHSLPSSASMLAWMQMLTQRGALPLQAVRPLQEASTLTMKRRMRSSAKSTSNRRRSRMRRGKRRCLS